MLAVRLLGVSAALLLLPGLLLLCALRVRAEWPHRIVLAFSLSYSWVFVLSIVVPLFEWSVDYAGVLTVLMLAGLGGYIASRVRQRTLAAYRPSREALPDRGSRHRMRGVCLGHRASVHGRRGTRHGVRVAVRGWRADHVRQHVAASQRADGVSPPTLPDGRWPDLALVGNRPHRRLSQIQSLSRATDAHLPLQRVAVVVGDTRRGGRRPSRSSCSSSCWT
jgi:hypothetical protein